MTGDSPVDRVQAIVTRIARPDRTPPDAGAATPLGEGGFHLDSVDLLQMACAEHFGIVLRLNWDSLRDTVLMV
jgi:hypothetical protein